ncbi:MAG: hypothetical protein NT100_04725 [Rhodococcus sp.]|nr:hypothetical protein [Rhodococcus sp. (in: high G+C Gram-positive bacteria)]
MCIRRDAAAAPTIASWASAKMSQARVDVIRARTDQRKARTCRTCFASNCPIDQAASARSP